MSRTFHHGKGNRGRGDYRLRVRGVRREPADLRRLARALIELARAEAEAAAQAGHETADEQHAAERAVEADDKHDGTQPTGDAA